MKVPCQFGEENLNLNRWTRIYQRGYNFRCIYFLRCFTFPWSAVVASTLDPSALRRVAEARESIFYAALLVSALCKRLTSTGWLPNWQRYLINRRRAHGGVILHHAPCDSTASWWFWRFPNDFHSVCPNKELSVCAPGRWDPANDGATISNKAFATKLFKLSGI